MVDTMSDIFTYIVKSSRYLRRMCTGNRAGNYFAFAMNKDKRPVKGTQSLFLPARILCSNRNMVRYAVLHSITSENTTLL